MPKYWQQYRVSPIIEVNLKHPAYLHPAISKSWYPSMPKPNDKLPSTSSSSSKENKGSKPALQSNLFAFFASSVPTPPKKKQKLEVTASFQKEEETIDQKYSTSTTGQDDKLSATSTANTVPVSLASNPLQPPAVASKFTTTTKTTTTATATTTITTSSNSDKRGIPSPMVPTPTLTPPNITWQSLHDNFVLVRRPAPKAMSNFFGRKSSSDDNSPMHSGTRTKVAAIDLDGTLVVWTCGGYPSQLSHYEIWNTTVPIKLRQLYDEGYQLLLVSNQASIQKAHTGKKAKLIQNVMNWIAELVDRPIYAVISTQSSKRPGSFHKPSPKLWQVARKYLQGDSWKLQDSFYVGDSADVVDDPQGGVDAKFAQAVGLRFFTPTEFFGAPSDYERRQRQRQYATEVPPPDMALQARLALLGGYWKAPILLILCGVQGSGKSTFCETLKKKSSNLWTHLSQDSIGNGKPGKREQVEAAAREALAMGKCAAIDRMHLTVEQRSHFVKIGRELEIPVHVVWLNPPSTVIAQRVKERTDHPGKVQGDGGVRIVLRSQKELVNPNYAEEGIALISCATFSSAAARLADLYAKVVPSTMIGPDSLITLSDDLALPMISLGTMGIGKRIAKETIHSAVTKGVLGFDTAPTYKNETEIGEVLSELTHEAGVKVIAKIPKSVVRADQVRESLELTLQNLQRSSVDLLLLHWPSDVISAGTLSEVWGKMEECCKEGLCSGLGVCNFNVAALRQLLADCAIQPLINQIERHPLCAQGEVMDFCARHGIHIQAHTPLGQGKEILLQSETVQAIAREVGRSPAAVVLQWNIQHGVGVVPKCQNMEHLQDLLFRRQMLSPEQMEYLDAMDCNKRMVTPPFMYGKAAHCWDERMSRRS